MKHPVLRGHPFHAAASDLPAGLLPAALVAPAEELEMVGERLRERGHEAELEGAREKRLAFERESTFLPG